MEPLSAETRDIIGSILHTIERCCELELGEDGFWMMLRAAREEEIRTGHLLHRLDELPPRDREAFWTGAIRHMLGQLAGARSPKRLLSLCEQDVVSRITRTCDIAGVTMDGRRPDGTRKVSRGFGLSW